MATDEFAHPGSVFRMQYCYLHDQNGGNNIKSRAERNEIYYNWVSGGFYGEIELIGPDPHGNKNVNTDTAREDSDVVGNVFQHIATQGTRMARVGGDGTGDTKGRYRFVNNTFILRQGQVSPGVEIFEGIESLEMHNNVFFRVGGAPIDKIVLETRVRWVSGRVSTGTNNWVPTGSAMIPTAWTGTVSGTNPGFTNIAPSTCVRLRPVHWSMRAMARRRVRRDIHLSIRCFPRLSCRRFTRRWRLERRRRDRCLERLISEHMSSRREVKILLVRQYPPRSVLRHSEILIRQYYRTLDVDAGGTADGCCQKNDLRFMTDMKLAFSTLGCPDWDLDTSDCGPRGSSATRGSSCARSLEVWIYSVVRNSRRRSSLRPAHI